MIRPFDLPQLADFGILNLRLSQLLLAAPKRSSGHWQSQDVSSRPEMQTRELTNVVLDLPIEITQLCRMYIQPSVPWADDHFEERVSGTPYNPPPSEAWWPYSQHHNEAHKEGQIFSHTYPERFWPKNAGQGNSNLDVDASSDWRGHVGIRYRYGDLQDVVSLLKKDPTTRQAYLPVWFPEDTGAVEGQRVPCTLGYQFLLRDNRLNITYHIRSCDFLRHFRDDVYMAMRLCNWVTARIPIGSLKSGDLIMHIGSLHIFEGDVPMLQAKLEAERHEQDAEFTRRLAMAL